MIHAPAYATKTQTQQVLHHHYGAKLISLLLPQQPNSIMVEQQKKLDKLSTDQCNDSTHTAACERIRQAIADGEGI